MRRNTKTTTEKPEAFQHLSLPDNLKWSNHWVICICQYLHVWRTLTLTAHAMWNAFNNLYIASDQRGQIKLARRDAVFHFRKNMQHLLVDKSACWNLLQEVQMINERESAAGLLSFFIDYWNCFSSSPVTCAKTAVWGITKSSECSSAGTLTPLLSLHSY